MQCSLSEELASIPAIQTTKNEGGSSEKKRGTTGSQEGSNAHTPLSVSED